MENKLMRKLRQTQHHIREQTQRLEHERQRLERERQRHLPELSGPRIGALPEDGDVTAEDCHQDTVQQGEPESKELPLQIPSNIVMGKYTRERELRQSQRLIREQSKWLQSERKRVEEEKIVRRLVQRSHQVSNTSLLQQVTNLTSDANCLIIEGTSKLEENHLFNEVKLPVMKLVDDAREFVNKLMREEDESQNDDEMQSFNDLRIDKFNTKIQSRPASPNSTPSHQSTNMPRLMEKTM